ncbi:hypothetical protein [Streptomyces sp. NPDC086519]|uniref:hypothetical protein n=1 Tax=Streptomyces sp. NPDC086519 TaxID=3154863 RepID=UPI003437B553
MEWTTLVSTLAGATIAMGSALLVERRRDRRDLAIDQDRHRRQMETEWRVARQELYSSFLADLTQARNEMRRIARDPETSHDQKAHAARAAFISCYGLRYQMEILAPSTVAGLAIELFRAVRNLRDDFTEGAVAVSSEDSRLTNEYHEALRALRAAMRDDLGVGPFPSG